jgi:competence protein ComEC
MFDRPALTFRTLAVAAFAVLLLAPQAVVHPSFQMSFAATLALVAGYQFTLPWQSTADSSLTARAALWGAREIVGLIFASLLAGLATTPYAAFHFHRLAPYGVLANLLAMPVVSGWVMPMGILGVIALPFGFDAPFWRMMGEGIDWMTAVAQWVAHLPGAVGRIAAFGVGPLLMASAGIVVTCLLRTQLRWAGAAMIVLAALWASVSPQPDIYIAGDGQTAAIRGADGRLNILRQGHDTFVIKEWLAADADARAAGDKTLTGSVKCDDAGCIARLPDGRAVAMPLTIEALLEDCKLATVVVSSRVAPTDQCAAALFDRNTLRTHGAQSLRVQGSRFEISAARPTGYSRPWAEAPVRKTIQQPDATPPLTQLTPDDY